MGFYERWIPTSIRQNLLRQLSNTLPTSFNNISLDFKIKRFANGTDLKTPIRHQQWLGSFTSEQKRRFLVPDLRRTETQTFELVEKSLANCNAQDEINRVLYQDMKFYMEGDILVKADRASMSASLEVRVPLLNKLLLDFAARLPHHYKLHGLTTKYLLRRAAEGILPKSISQRAKKGFNIPVAKWLAGPLLEMTRDMLHPDRLRAQGIFAPEEVQKMLTGHLKRRVDARKHLWTLLTFEMWYENWCNTTTLHS
jgi:asparagine synthase (glutamine-hydrolysing)